MKIRNYNLNLKTSNPILKDKKFNMELYALLLAESNFFIGEENRYISVADINFKEWGKSIHLSAATVKKHLDHLIEIGVIKRWTSSEDKDYLLIPNKHKDGYRILPDYFVKSLIDLKCKNLLKVYLIYLNFTEAYGYCSLTQYDILNNIGLTYNSKNATMLRNINELLEKNKLIETNVSCVKDQGSWKRILTIKSMNYKDSLLFLKNKA